jgi:hypothetical protein
MEQLKKAYLKVLFRLRGVKIPPQLLANAFGILGCILIGIGVFLFSVPIGFIASGIMSIVIGSQIMTNGADNEYPR